MKARGFTLVELLIAMAIILTIGAIVAAMVPPARAAFDRVPADLDLQQRGRTAINVLSQALRSSGRTVAATTTLGALSDLLPTVSVTDHTLTMIAPIVDGAQGALSVAQGSPSGVLTLAVSPCPNIKDVCGFVPGARVVIADGVGGHDQFTVSTTSAGARTLKPDHVLSRAYPAGSVVIEVDRDIYRLDPQPDGTSTLVRETVAGAVQPIVDFVEDLTFAINGEAVAAGFLRVDRVDVSVRMQAHTDAMRRAIADRVFRTSIRLRNAS